MPEQTRAWFESTSWSLVLDAREDSGALERLLRVYWGPVYAFVRRRGYGPHDASDLTQDFLANVVLGRSFLERADARRGRFRSFLKASLRNFLIDDHRRAVRRVSAGSLSPDDSGRRPDPPDARAGAPDEAFDRQWAATVLALTVSRLEASCERDGLSGHWEAFRLNVLNPLTRRGDALALEALAERVGASDAAQASNMLQTVKRRFRAALREVVSETVASPADVEAELRELKRLVQ